MLEMRAIRNDEARTRGIRHGERPNADSIDGSFAIQGYKILCATPTMMLSDCVTEAKPLVLSFLRRSAAFFQTAAESDGISSAPLWFGVITLTAATRGEGENEFS